MDVINILQYKPLKFKTESKGRMLHGLGQLVETTARSNAVLKGMRLLTCAEISIHTRVFFEDSEYTDT